MIELFLNFLKTLFTLFFELSLLFIFISFLVSWLQRVVTEEKIRNILNQPHKWLSYVYGAFFGALTPFCSCSTIPILAGLLSAGAPFGPAISFLIASPLLNPIIIILLFSLFSWKITLLYTVSLFIFSIVSGVIWEQAGLSRFVKVVKVGKGTSPHDTRAKWKLAFSDAWSFFYPLLPYLFIGVLIGAIIYDFVPHQWITTYAGPGNGWAIFASALLGIPMYIRVETMMPIGAALVSKGMGLGAVIALVIGGAGASIPEIVLLSKLFKVRLVTLFIVTILIAAVSTGYIIHFII